jgi:hypothetical protein
MGKTKASSSPTGMYGVSNQSGIQLWSKRVPGLGIAERIEKKHLADSETGRMAASRSEGNEDFFTALKQQLCHQQRLGN